MVEPATWIDGTLYQKILGSGDPTNFKVGDELVCDGICYKIVRIFLTKEGRIKLVMTV